MSNLRSRLTAEYLAHYGRVVLDIGIDGIPLTDSGINDFWPILGRLEGDISKPFLIGVLCGPGKPRSLSEYLSRYCDEVLELEENGVEIDGVNYPFQIRDYILDAVARQQFKCITGPCSEKACEKCTVRGVWHKGRETFADLNCPLRTDESFSERQDRAHHTGTSPLESRLNTKMISQFRLDPMHLVHLGNMKRFLKQIVKKGPRKLHWRVIHVLSDGLQCAGTYLPREFSRLQFKELKYFSRYKATELRALLLYVLVVVFKLLPQESVNIYRNFLLLHVCIFILSSKVLLNEYCHLAERFARAHVEYSVALFGKEYCVYNVHSLIHLPSECRMRGELESFSAYPFENFLQILVNVVKSGNQPLQQLINRVTERENYLAETKSEMEADYLLEQEVREDAREFGDREFNLIKLKGGFCLGVNKRDRCFCANDGSIVVLSNIVKTRGQILLYGRKFDKKENFYTSPSTPPFWAYTRCQIFSAQRSLLRLVRSNISACFCLTLLSVQKTAIPPLYVYQCCIQW